MLKRDVFREAVTRDVILRDGVPGAVFDRHARLMTNSFKTHVPVRRLLRQERRLPPRECETLARLPDRYTADLEFLAACQRRKQAPADTRLEGERAVATRCDLEKRAGFPPQGDLLREGFERAVGIRRYAQRDLNARRHVFFFSR